MSIASRFAKLLASSVDPQSYAAMHAEAEQRARTVHECLVEIAQAALDREVFRGLRQEAEAREAQARGVADVSAKSPPKASVPMKVPQKTHVQERLSERYSLEVTAAEIEQFEQLIQQKSPAAKLVKQVARISVHYEIQMLEKDVTVIYDPKLGRVMTAIPKQRYQTSASGDRLGRTKEAVWNWRLEDVE